MFKTCCICKSCLKAMESNSQSSAPVLRDIICFHINNFTLCGFVVDQSNLLSSVDCQVHVPVMQPDLIIMIVSSHPVITLSRISATVGYDIVIMCHT